MQTRTRLRAALAIGLVAASNVCAQVYPSKPIRLVVPFPAGGATDIIGRTIGARMSEGLGQPIVIENRAGAGGTIGADIVAKSAPDGYTILLGEPGSMAINPSLMAALPYQPLRDFAPIGQAVNLPLVLVAPPTLGARSFADAVAMKSRDLVYGSAGSGTIQHLAMEQLRGASGMRLIHVPYKGGGPALTDLVAARIDLLVLTIPTLQPQLRAGKVVTLVTFSERRAAALPEVPTIAEAGYPQLTLSAWQGFFVPAGTAPEIVQRLNVELARAAASAEVREKLAAAGAEVLTGTPDALARLLREDIERWAKVIRAAGVRAE